MDRTRVKLATVTLITIVLMAFAAWPTAAQDSAAPAASPPPQTPEQTSATNDQVLRSYLQIQEQLHTAQLAIESNREQLEATAKQNNEIVAGRLKLIEQTLTAQGERETKTARSSQRLVLIIAGIFGIVGIGAMVLTSWFQLRTMNRLTELGGSSGFFRQLDAPVTTTISAVPPAILEAIQRLEQRLLEYQNTRALPEPQPNGNGSHGASAHPDPEDRDRLTVLLGKGQTLMRLNRPGEALDVFDEALAIDPENADTYVKKGSALERMKKLEEAIACYDRAIAANASMTLAYLCKGGVFNQMERFAEALECYEQALRSQHKTPAAA
ncbi:MAG TPA: tetratricopeptide repeat protein [Candidatus Binatia bacterium]|nr:tetratricopeptide repeat protein [Candidatus Binatia bacterium]